ncbi:hypothetical protein D3C72_1503460 [compost metagenome]
MRTAHGSESPACGIRHQGVQQREIKDGRVDEHGARQGMATGDSHIAMGQIGGLRFG